MRHFSSLASVALILTVAAYPAFSSQSVDEQRQVRSCLSNLFQCFPSDYQDPSEVTCSDTANITCVSSCPSDGQTFFNNLLDSKYEQLTDECHSKYCYSGFDDCLGSVLHAAYSSGNWSTACNAWAQQSSCISNVNATCTDELIFSKYSNLFNYGCASSTTKSYLASFTACFPYSFFDLTQIPAITDLCRNSSAVLSCEGAIMKPSDLSSIAGAFFDGLAQSHSDECTTEQVCKSVLTSCLGMYVSQSLPPTILQNYICSNLQDLNGCVENAEYQCIYPADVNAYLQDSCYELVCEAGLESCYSEFQTPMDYSTDVSTAVASFCSVTVNITSCLNDYSVPCAAAKNPDASFRSSVNDLCQGNAVAPGTCYWSALQCFYQYYPTLTKPSALWSTNSDVIFCNNVNATVNCLETALGGCSSDTDKYSDAIQNLMDVIGLQCLSVCSYQKASACQDSMTYYLTQLWTNTSSSAANLCGTLAKQQSCYTTLSKQCSGTTSPVVNSAVLNSIQIAIEESSCNFTTTPTIPSGCSVSTAIGDVTTFLNETYMIADLSANNYSTICQEWAATKPSLTSMVSLCPGGIDGRISAMASAVDAVIIPLCNGQCQMKEAAPSISYLQQQVQAAQQFKIPVDYMGNPKKMFCIEDSDGDEDCYDYPFYWGSICRQINATLNNVTEYTKGCSDTVKKAQMDFVNITAGVYSEQCQTQEFVCNVELGSQCLTNFSLLSIYYPLMSNNDQKLACSLASNYTSSMWMSLVQCSPYFYLDVWPLLEAWLQDFKCTPPTIFDNVNTSQPLNTTQYETTCGADMIAIYMKKFDDALISHCQDATGDSSKLNRQWNETSTAISSVLNSESSSGDCSKFVPQITTILDTINTSITIITENQTGCDLGAANDCVKSLQDFVDQRGLKKPPCGCPVPSTDETKSEFCSRAKAALSCIAESTMTCQDDAVAAMYSKLYGIQNSTDVNCLKPCDSNPCQHGSICSNNADGTTYSCKCPTGFSGKNCESIDCDTLKINQCFQSTVQSLFAANYSGYCQSVQGAMTCVSGATKNCPSPYFDIANDTLQQLSTNFKSHCDTTVPPPMPDCDGSCVTCLSTKYNSMFWDMVYGGLTDSVCSQWPSIKVCVTSSTAQCSGIPLSIEALFSFLCTSIDLTCHRQKVVDHAGDFNYGCWRANANRPNKPMGSKSPDDELDGVCPHMKQNTMNKVNERHGRHENDKQPPPGMDNSSDDDSDEDYDDYEDDSCWYLEKQLNMTLTAANNCSMSVQNSITSFVQRVTKQYLSNGQCDEPCENNQCSNLATCIPDNYGYDCQCLPGYMSLFCDEIDTNVTVACNSSISQPCLTSAKTLLQSIINGPYSAAQCSSLNATISCLSTSYLSCNNAANSANFQLIQLLYNEISSSCKNQTNVVKTCALNASVACVSKLIDGIQMQSDTYCGLLGANYESAKNISAVCSSASDDSTDLASRFKDQCYSSYSLVCSTEQCSIEAAKDCLNVLYDKVANNIGDGSVCDIAISTEECLSESLMTCDVDIRAEFNGLCDSYMSSVTPQCVDACATQACSNGGTCTRTYDGDGFNCTCTNGFGGKRCDSPSNCDSDSIGVCIETASSVFVSLLDPCQMPACSELKQLTACMIADSTGCSSTKKSLIAAAAAAVAQLNSICSSKKVACTEPPTCPTSNITAVCSQYISEALENITSVIGPSFEDICGGYNKTQSLLLNMAKSGCSPSYTASVNAVVNWMKTISGKDCSTPTTCQVPQAQSCIDSYNSKVADAKKRIYCQIALAKETTQLDAEKDKCVQDNTEKCTDDEKAPVIENSNNSTQDAQALVPKPCNENPCVDNATCVPVESGEFICTCQPDGSASNGPTSSSDDSCYKEPDCKLNDATDCVNSYRKYIELKGCIGNVLRKTDVDDYCKNAKKALDCAVQATAPCSSNLTSNIFTTLYSIQDAVGWTCFGYCDSMPCKYSGACNEMKKLASYPANVMLPKNGFTCKCAPGYSGDDCNEPEFSVPAINKCFVDVLTAIFNGDSQGLCNGPLIPTMASCISSNVTTCPVGRREIASKISSNMQTVLQGTICPVATATCDMPTVKNQCCADISRLTMPLWNANAQHGDDNYCRKQTQFQSCSVPGCDSVVAIANAAFQLVCDNSSSPLVNITNLLDIIERISCQKNNSDSTPPPVDTTPVDQPENPRVLDCTAITYKEVYIDGVMQGDGYNADVYSKIFQFILPTEAQLIAIKGQTDEYSAGGIIASTDDGFIVTDGSWKCSSVGDFGWMTIDYDDSGWAQAVPVDVKDIKMYDRSGIFDQRAMFIWTAKKSGKYDETVYCRAFFGDRQIRIAASCFFELYIDGSMQDVTNNNQSTQVCKASVDSGSHAIAVHSSCPKTPTPYGFILEISSGLLVTDGTWKCSSSVAAGWYSASYDITSWTSAAVVAQNDGTKFASMAGISMKTSFIWAADATAQEVFCRAPMITIPPTTNTTPIQPEPPIDFNQANQDFCWYLQKGIDLINGQLNQISNDCQGVVKNSLSGLIANYSADKTCEKPCDMNQCEDNSNCSARGYGYDCICLPGFNGSHCEQGGNCNIQKAKPCLDKLSQCGSDVLTPGDWRPSVCSKITPVYECIAVSLMPCSDASKLSFELLNQFLNFVNSTCSSTATTPSPPPCPCETRALLKCGLKTVNDQFVAPTGDSCGNLNSLYNCLTSIEASCGSNLTTTNDLRLETWQILEKQCKPPQCSISDSSQCVFMLLNSYNASAPFDNSSCTLVSSTEQCVTSNTSGCDKFIKAYIDEELSSALEAVNVTGNCVSVCSNNHCENNGVCEAEATGSYECQCPNQYTGDYCEENITCSLSSINQALALSEDPILDGLMDSCNTPFPCSVKSSLATELMTYSSGCDSTVKPGIGDIKNAINALVCSAMSPQPCSNPQPSCQYEDLRGCSSTFFDLLSEEYCKPGGPDYLSVCREFNNSMSCFSSVSCTQDPFKTSFSNTVTFFQSIVGSKCSASICQPTVAQNCLNALNATVNSLIDPTTNKVPPVMCKDDQDKFCGKIQSSVECIQGDLSQCPSGAQRDTIIAQMNAIVSNVSGLCPLPCQANPCVDEGTCEQTDAYTYQCNCPGDVLGDECKKVPSCDTNGAYAEVQGLKNFLFWNNVVKPVNVQSTTLPPSFFTKFCSQVNQTSTSLPPYVASCDSDTRKHVYSTLNELQSFCNVSCVPQCSSSPCQNDGICMDIDSSTYNCKCPTGYNGTNCEQDLCPLTEISYGIWHSVKLLLSSFDQLCSTLTMSPDQTKNASMNCNSAIKSFTNTVQQDFNTAVTPLCSPGSVGTSPDCNISSLNMQCLSGFQSQLGYFDNTTDLQAAILCNTWMAASMQTMQCSSVITALQEVFGYLCTNPSPTPNVTCALHDTVAGIKDFEHSSWQANQTRPTNNVQPPPASVDKCKMYEMPPVNRNPPVESEDVCQNAEDSQTKVKNSASGCSDSMQLTAEEALDNLTSENLGQGQCDNPCEPNLCANLGTCTKQGDFGYNCSCMPSFAGRNCETGGACDESSAYTDCYSPIDQYYSGSITLIMLCRNLDTVSNCLSEKMLACTKVCDEVVFQLVIKHVQALSNSCNNQNNNETNSCELEEVYYANRHLLDTVHLCLAMPNPQPSVCSALSAYQTSIKNITMQCTGGTTSLTETLIEQSYGAQDRVCQNPNCSISTANACIEKLREIMTSAQDNSTCGASWMQKACVQESMSECDDVLKDATKTAVKDVMTSGNTSCASPCDTLPCRNNGTCQQTDVDSYECMCTTNYTGKYCEIETKCNLVGVQSCYNDSIGVITSLLVDPCYSTPLNCSYLNSSFSECVSNYSSGCPDNTTNERLELVDSAVGDISYLCTADRPPPPNCDVPPVDCSVDDIRSCTYNYLKVVFAQYSAFGGANYGLICSQLNETKSCFSQFSTTCTPDYLSSLNSSLEWLSNLAGPICKQETICEPEPASSMLLYTEQEIGNYTARPGSIPDDDHTDFCSKMKDCVASVKGNTDQCANGSQPEIEEELEMVQENISRICPFPCNSNPCLNGGNCTETSWNNYTCQCEDGFGGMTCNEVLLHPYKNHSKLNCMGQDRSTITQQIRLSVPFQLFCQQYSSLYVTEDGYVSVSDGSLIINFAKFCQNKHTILAPLFAGQDCSCPNSAVYYQEYFVSGTDPQQGQELGRASKDVQRCSSAKAPDFSATSIFIVTWENMMPYPCTIFQSLYGVTMGSTYQLVIASDMTSTFGQFIYSQVNVKYQVPFVYSGFTDLQGRCINSVQSGTSAMDHFEKVPSNSSGDNSWIYPLFDDSCATSEPKPEDQCLTWVASADDLSDQTLDPCPCSGRIAAIDPRYHFEYIDWFRYCYATNRVQIINSPSGRRASQVKQVCCFDPFSNGTLITSPPYAGFPVVLDANSATGNDSQAHLWCCTQSNKYCSLYLSLRPIGVCNSYTAPVEALLWGDPHYITMDYFNYTFNGVGEFILAETVDGSFNFQARTSVYTDASGKAYAASVFSALAAQEAGEVKTEVDLNAARNGLVLFVNGTQISQNSVINYYGNVYVAWSGNSINITYPSGWTMTVMLASRSLSFIHTAPNAYRNKTIGLLGNFNGDPTDDLRSRNGVVLPPTASIQEIHYQVGLTWQITAAESLFTYPPGKTAADYVNASFVPAFEPPCYTNADKLAGWNVCNSNEFCYFDYCVTKDPTMAANTKQTVADYSNNLQILSSLAPILTIVGVTPNPAGQFVINATLNSMVTFRLQATSQQNLIINYYMVGNISQDPTAKLNASTGVFRWTPSSLSVVDVGFIAIDSNGGASAKLQVVISMCDGCSAHGSCNFASFTLLGNGTNYQLADCTCDVGWTVPSCSQDFDGCASQPCGSGNAAACTDMTPQQQQQTHLSYTCSSCPSGYYTNQCVDIDECSQGTSQCTQVCTNAIGSYTCGCNKGYRLTTNFTCTDIDECKEETSSCSQVCVNTQGSFTCSCYPGFQGPNCDPSVPCGSNNCDYKCSNISNNPTCVCEAGYQLGSDGHTCTDVNECVSATSDFCSYKDLCTNTLGGYTCGCPAGLQVSSDSRTCQDCPDGYWGLNCSNICNCDMRVKQCNKTNGCTICQSGWTGPVCETDVDECALGTYTCSANSVCHNVPGTYTCVCLIPSQTNPDNTCGNNVILFKLNLKLTWKSDYSDFSNAETEILKELIELQLQKIFSKIPNYVTVSVVQFFESESSGIGTTFQVSFNTALSPASKAGVGQTLVNSLIQNNWTLPVLSNPEVISVPEADFGNGTYVPAGDPCLDNTQCQNGGTCMSAGISIPTCICAGGYTGWYCESKSTSPSGTPSGGSSNSLTIGLAVGLSLGILFLALAAVAIVYIIRRRREKQPYDSAMMLDDASLHKYAEQPVRYHPKWPFSSGTGFDHTDS